MVNVMTMTTDTMRSIACSLILRKLSTDHQWAEQSPPTSRMPPHRNLDQEVRPAPRSATGLKARVAIGSGRVGVRVAGVPGFVGKLTELRLTNGAPSASPCDVKL